VRPAYIQNVNNYYQQIKAGTFTTTGPVVSAATPVATTVNTTTVSSDTSSGSSPGLDVLNAILGPFAIEYVKGPQSNTSGTGGLLDSLGKAVAGFVNFVTLPNLGMRMFAGFTGMIFLVLGVYFFATDGNAS